MHLFFFFTLSVEGKRRRVKLDTFSQHDVWSFSFFPPFLHHTHTVSYDKNTHTHAHTLNTHGHKRGAVQTIWLSLSFSLSQFLHVRLSSLLLLLLLLFLLCFSLNKQMSDTLPPPLLSTPLLPPPSIIPAMLEASFPKRGNILSLFSPPRKHFCDKERS